MAETREGMGDRLSREGDGLLGESSSKKINVGEKLRDLFVDSFRATKGWFAVSENRWWLAKRVLLALALGALTTGLIFAAPAGFAAIGVVAFAHSVVHIPLAVEIFTVALATLLPFMDKILGLISSNMMSLFTLRFALWADRLESGTGEKGPAAMAKRVGAFSLRFFADIFAFALFAPAALLRTLAAGVNVVMTYLPPQDEWEDETVASDAEKEALGKLFSLRLLKALFSREEIAELDSIDKIISTFSEKETNKLIFVLEHLLLIPARALHYLIVRLPVDIVARILMVPAYAIHKLGHALFGPKDGVTNVDQPPKMLAAFEFASKVLSIPAGLIALVFTVPGMTAEYPKEPQDDAQILVEHPKYGVEHLRKTALDPVIEKMGVFNFKRLALGLVLGGVMALLLFVPGSPVMAALMAIAPSAVPHLVCCVLTMAAATLLPFAGDFLGFISQVLTAPTRYLASKAESIGEVTPFGKFVSRVSRGLANVGAVFFIPAALLRAAASGLYVAVSYLVTLGNNSGLLAEPEPVAGEQEQAYENLAWVSFLKRCFNRDDFLVRSHSSGAFKAIYVPLVALPRVLGRLLVWLLGRSVNYLNNRFFEKPTNFVTKGFHAGLEGLSVLLSIPGGALILFASALEDIVNLADKRFLFDDTIQDIKGTRALGDPAKAPLQQTTTYRVYSGAPTAGAVAARPLGRNQLTPAGTAAGSTYRDSAEPAPADAPAYVSPGALAPRGRAPTPYVHSDLQAPEEGDGTPSDASALLTAALAAGGKPPVGLSGLAAAAGLPATSGSTAHRGRSRSRSPQPTGRAALPTTSVSLSKADVETLAHLFDAKAAAAASTGAPPPEPKGQAPRPPVSAAESRGPTQV